MKKTFVVGDIHGCYDEFIALLNQMGVTDEDLVISLGDIVDRGNKSVELYHYFKNRKNSVVLMGNHERKHLNGTLSYSQEIVKVQFGEEYDEFLAWLKILPYSYQTDEAIIVHAFFEHDQPLAKQKEEVLAGTTSGSRYLEKKYAEGTYWSEYYTGETPIIYGHHVVGDTPKVLNNTYGIDTGACHGGKLTAIELPSFQIHQIQVTQDYWKSEREKWQVPVLAAKDWNNMSLDRIQQQIENLSYKSEESIQQFLHQLSDWLNELEKIQKVLLEKLIALVSTLQEQYPTNFNQEVARLPYRTFIFKAKSNKLKLADVQKTLDTPAKILDLAEQLEIKYKKQELARN